MGLGFSFVSWRVMDIIWITTVVEYGIYSTSTTSLHNIDVFIIDSHCRNNKKKAPIKA